MTVIIRLQSLPWTANALDIRRFFQGLAIPDGGVHIVGGEKGDAFIAFTTDDDARQAMYMDNSCVHETPIKLLLSSKTEMQTVISVARGAAPGSGGQAMGEFNRGNQQGNLGGPPISQHGGPNNQPPMGGQNQRGFGGMDKDGRTPGNNLGPISLNFNQQPQGQGLGNQFEGRGMGGFERSGGMDRGGPGIVDNDNRGATGGMDNFRGTGFNDMQQESREGGSMIGGDFMNSGGGNRNFEQQRGGPGGNFDGPGRGGQDHVGQGGQDHRGQDHRGHDHRGRGQDHGGQGGGQDHGRRGGGQDHHGRRGGGQDNNGRGGQEIGRQDQFARDVDRNFDGQEGFGEQDTFRMQGGTANFEDRHFGRRDRNLNNQDQAGFDMGEQQGNLENAQGNWGRNMEAPRDNRTFGDGDLRGGDGFHGDFDNNRSGFNQDMPPMNEEPMHRSFSEMDRDMPRDNFNKNEGRFDNREDGFPPRDLRVQNVDGDFRGERRGYDIEHNNRMQNMDRGMDFDREQQFPERRESFNREFRGRGGFGRGNFRGRGNDRNTTPRKRGREPLIFLVVSNMPPTISYKDVRRYFGGCEIPRDGLKLLNDNDGSRVGTAYVKFVKEVDCYNALKKDGLMMDSKRVQVDRCTSDEFDASVDSYVPGSNNRFVDPQPVKRNRSRSPLPKSPEDGSNCFIMRNVHYRANKNDLIKFLGNANLTPNGGPFIDMGKDGRTTGNAMVEFDGKRGYDQALDLHKKPCMGRAVKLEPISKKEFDQLTASHRNPQEDTRQVEVKDDKKSEILDDKPYYCVKMIGLPFSATNQSIEGFFEGLEIAKRGMHLVYNRQGLAAGVAFVEFVSQSHCKKALEKDKQYMGKRYIELSPISKKDMLVELREEQQKQNGAPRMGHGDAPTDGTHQGCTMTMGNLPFQVQLEDIMTFFRGFQPIQDTVRLRYSKGGKPTGDAMLQFHDTREAQRAQQELHRKVMMGRPVMLALTD